jgi:hypothetical protein
MKNANPCKNAHPLPTPPSRGKRLFGSLRSKFSRVVVVFFEVN